MSFEVIEIQENYTLLQNTTPAISLDELQQQLVAITTPALIWKVQHIQTAQLIELLETIQLPERLFLAVAADINTMEQYQDENPQITVLPTTEECIDAVFMYLLEQQFNEEADE
jgi:hypothetical protein